MYMYMYIHALLTYTFSNKELMTTLTEEKAIAALAIHGCNVTPIGTRNPAANGIPITLYTTAHIKLALILLTVRPDRLIAAITSIRLFYMSDN